MTPIENKQNLNHSSFTYQYFKIMRKLLLFLIIASFLTHGQAQDTTSSSIDSMLVNIDQREFTSGVLYDRVFPWAHLDVFNDTIRPSHKTLFEQALLEATKKL